MKQETNNSGISFLGVLALLFIALKLLGVIDWSWSWVLAPIWIPLAFAGTVLFIIFCIEKADDRKIRRQLKPKIQEIKTRKP